MASLAPRQRGAARGSRGADQTRGRALGPDYAVLVPLSESPDGTLRARELRREILRDRTRLSHHVKRMEERGLIAPRSAARTRRRHGAHNRRRAGRDRRRRPGHVAATRRYFFDLVSDDEIDVLTAVFDRVLANLQPALGPREPPGDAPLGD